MENTNTRQINPYPQRPRIPQRSRPNPTPPAARPAPEPDERMLLADRGPRQSVMEIKDGIYPLTLVAVDDEADRSNKGKRRWVWKFLVKGYEGVLYFYSSDGCGAKVEQALTALKVEFAKNGDTELSKSDVIGRTCMGRIEKVTTRRGGVFPRLKQLFPETD